MLWNQRAILYSDGFKSRRGRQYYQVFTDIASIWLWFGLAVDVSALTLTESGYKFPELEWPIRLAPPWTYRLGASDMPELESACGSAGAALAWSQPRKQKQELQLPV
jgi:hypothetical protein